MNNDVQEVLGILGVLRFERILYLVVGFIALVYLVKIIKKSAESLYVRFPTKRLFLLQIVTIISFSIYIGGGIFVFYFSLQPTKEFVFALGGSVAVAVGFSIKDIITSLIGGITLLFDRPFKVGDRVTFDGVYGEIKNIGLRAVQLITLSDDVVTIPNSKFISDTVMSSNFGALDMMQSQNFHVALDEDIDKIKEILYEIVVTSKYAYIKKPVNISVQEVAIANRLALCFSVKSYVIDVKYEKPYETDIVSRTAEAFKKFKIKRPL